MLASARSRTDRPVQNGGYTTVEWQFFPSSASGFVADDLDLFTALDNAGIPFFINVP